MEHMFDVVDTELGITSSPDLINEIRSVEREISHRRARQVRLLRELMRRRPFSKPSLDPAEIAAQLDVSADTAGGLLETATRSPELSERMARFECGEWSFDRAVAMARLFAAGADDQTMQAADERDIAGVHKLRAMTRRIRRRDERQAHEERYLRCSPSLDESVGFIHGQLGGYDWQILNQALDERVDQFPKEARVWSREQCGLMLWWLLPRTGSTEHSTRGVLRGRLSPSWSTPQRLLRPKVRRG